MSIRSEAQGKSFTLDRKQTERLPFNEDVPAAHEEGKGSFMLTTTPRAERESRGEALDWMGEHAGLFHCKWDIQQDVDVIMKKADKLVRFH